MPDGSCFGSHDSPSRDLYSLQSLKWVVWRMIQGSSIGAIERDIKNLDNCSLIFFARSWTVVEKVAAAMLFSEPSRSGRPQSGPKNRSSIFTVTIIPSTMITVSIFTAIIIITIIIGSAIIDRGLSEL